MSQPSDIRVLSLGTATSPVYTAKNFRGWCKGQNSGVVQRKSTGMSTPLFAKDSEAYFDADGKEKFGHKMYASCSWGEMLDMIRTTLPVLRNFYELVYYDEKAGVGDPVNIFMDLDLSLKDVEGEISSTVMDDVYDEVITCIELAIEKLVAMDIGGWHTAWKRDDFVVNTLTADIPNKKMSRHHLLHFPDNAMIKDVVHLKNFMGMVMDIHYERIDYDKSKSCMYYFHTRHKAFRPILDLGVYTRMRPFRMISCVKTKLDATTCICPLAPPCTHDGSCEEADCFYRHLRKTKERDFLANLITFVPPGPDGKPINVPLLELPNVPTPWLKHNDPCDPHRIHRLASYTSRNFDGNSTSPLSYSMVIGDRPSWKELFDVKDEESEFHVDQPHQRKKMRMSTTPTLNSIMEDICQALCRQTGNICIVKDDRIKDIGTAYIQTDSKMCPYASREHKSNHIAYQVSLNLPLPSVYIHCLDPDCNPNSEEDKKRRQHLELDKSLYVSIARDIHAYFSAQFITTKMLRLK